MTNKHLESNSHESVNHLGNFNGCWFCVARPYRHESRVYRASGTNSGVLVTFSDKRLSECQEDIVYRYVADVKSQTDYSAFGVLLEGRQWYSNSDTNSAIYGFNGMRKDNEIYGSGNAYDFGARIYDPRRGQWASVDPLARQYPRTSHYVAFGNNPIICVDPNGKENVIYLVFLPSADNKLTLQDAINIQNQANKNFENLGLKTRVVLVDNSLTGGKEFDARKMDRTDALAVLGTRENVIDFVLQQNRDFGEKLCNGWKGGWSHPEESENSPESGYNLGQGGGNIIALDANGVKANEAGVDGKTHSERIMKYGAFLINHGAGHNAGQVHEGQNTNSVIMATGKEVKFRLSNPKSSLPRIEDFTNNEPLPFDESTKRNQEYVNAVEDRFGVEDYKVNYKP